MLNSALPFGPLSKKIRKAEPAIFIKITDLDDQAVKTLKDELVTTSILTLQRRKDKLTVQTDPCDEQLISVLKEELLEEPEKAIQYCWQSSIRAKRSYTTA